MNSSKVSSNLQVVKDDEETAADEFALEASKEIAKMRTGRTPAVGELDRKGIIHGGMKDESAFNAFRELRTALMQKAEHQNFVVMVTSAVPGGGATHVALNLAMAITLDKTKTALIVDCNWRRPAVHERLGIEFSPGLLDLLDYPEDIGMKPIIMPTQIPRLRAIPIGSRYMNESEYFSSLNMRMFIKTLKRRYPDRFIVLDAPSVKNAADISMLAALSDFAVLVVPYGRNTAAQIDDAASTIGRDKLTGVVLNRQPGR